MGGFMRFLMVGLMRFRITRNGPSARRIPQPALRGHCGIHLREYLIQPLAGLPIGLGLASPPEAPLRSLRQVARSVVANGPFLMMGNPYPPPTEWQGRRVS